MSWSCRVRGHWASHAALQNGRLPLGHRQGPCSPRCASDGRGSRCLCTGLPRRGCFARGKYLPRRSSYSNPARCGWAQALRSVRGLTRASLASALDVLSRSAWASRCACSAAKKAALGCCCDAERAGALARRRGRFPRAIALRLCVPIDGDWPTWLTYMRLCRGHPFGTSGRSWARCECWQARGKICRSRWLDARWTPRESLSGFVSHRR